MIRTLFIVFLVSHFTVFAQTTYMKHLGVEDGLPSSVVYHVMEDNQHQMWFSTDRGVCRYNGFEITSFMVSDGVSDNEVFKCFEDSQNRVWFLTANGRPSCYMDGVFYTYEMLDELTDKSGYLLRMGEDENGDVWFGWTSGKTVRLSDKNHSIERVDNKFLKETGVSSVQFSNQGDVFGVSGSSTLYNFLEGNYVELDTSLKDSKLRHFITAKGHLLIALGEALVKFDGGLVQDSLKGEKIVQTDSSEILCIYEAKNQDIWLGTWKGVYLLDAETYRIQKRLLDGKPITSILEDSEQNMWFSTYGDGVYFLPQNTYQYYQRGKELCSGRLNEVYELENEIWITTGQSEINKIKDGRVEKMSLSNDLTGRGIIKGILFHEDGSQFITTDQGIYYAKNDQIQLINGKGIEIVTDHDQYILTSTHSGKIYCFDYHNYEAFFEEEQEPYFKWDRVVEAHHKEGSKFLMASYNELVEYDVKENSIRSLTAHLNPQMNILDFYSDSTDIWISTNGRGVYHLFHDEVSNYTTADGLSSNSCKAVFKYGDSLFVATNSTLDVIIQSTGEIRTFLAPEFFKSNEIQSVHIDHLDRVWVVSPNDVSVFPRESLNHKKEDVRLELKGILVDDRQLGAQESYELEHGFSQIAFNISATHYTNPGAISYRYRLHQSNMGWIHSESPIIQLPELEAGNYEVTIEALYNQFPVDDPVEFSIIVHAPLWVRWYMLLFYLVLCGVVIFVLIRYRIAGIRLKAHQQKEISDAQNKALRSQMNPHFVFNSLNSIQHFIVSNDARKANKYLARFSRLIRRVLDNSDRDLVSVSEEEELLKDYLTLERLRLNEAFDFEIKLDQQIDRLKTKIPTMLIQPFVENAVWHGVAKINYPGKIEVRIELQNSCLVCEVEDNGPGFIASQEKKRKSYGLTNSSARTYLMGDKSDYEVRIKNKTQTGEKGTLVSLKLPYTLDQ